MTIDIPQPSEEEHIVMLNSPQAREKRREQRIGRWSIGRANQGKSRPVYDSDGQFPFGLPESIPTGTIEALGKLLRGKQPLLDNFTNNHKAGPDKESIDRYIMAGNSRRYRPRRFDPESKEVNPNRIQDPAERQAVLTGMKRQSLHIGDLLEREQFNNLNNSLMRYEAIKTVQYMVATGQDLDPPAALSAASAIEDFGFALSYNPEFMRELRDEELGQKIINIGRRAVDNFELLADNPTLLRLARIEQTARIGFWQERFDATFDYLGDRLTLADREGQAGMTVEIDRYQGLREQ